MGCRAGIAVAVLGLLGLLGVAPPSLAQVSPSAFTSATRYDAARRVTGTIAPDPDGSGPLKYAAVRNSYDPAGRLVRQETGELSSWQPETTLSGQPLAPAAWSGFSVFTVVDTTYDAMSRKTRETVSGSGTAYAVTQYSYDAVGRLECTAVRMNQAAFGALPASACNLGPTGAQGPDRITRQVYDASGQLLTVQKAYATPLQQDYASYTYSPNGKQTSVTDANGNKALMTYDGFDRKVAWTFPSKANGASPAACAIGPITEANGITSPTEARGPSDDCEKYAYDKNGNRATLIKRDGQVIRYGYDALNRMTLKDIPGGTGADVYYAYDLRGLQLAARFGSSGGSDAVTSVYDGFGRLGSSTTSMQGTSRTLSYLYDADGNRVRVTHPDGTYFAYDYDGLDRAVAVRENGGTAVASMVYNPRGLRQGVTRGGVSTGYTYDPVSRPQSIADDLAGSAQDVTATFGYNPGGQLASRGRSNDGYAFTGYVNVNRSYGVNGLNQYTGAGPATFSYDPNGNLTGDGTTSYGYDVENRLLSASSGAALAWDPLGRLWQTSGGTGGTIRFLYDGDELVAEYDAAGNVLRRYVHGPGDDDPLLWYEGSGLSDRRSLQADYQGSIVSVANALGTSLQVNAYDEYGIPNATNQGRFQYTGQAWLPALGMYHYKARLYSPTLGRFMQTDPIGYDDQINLYAAVGNDPMNRADPTGLGGDCEFGNGPLTCKAPLSSAAAAAAAAPAATTGADIVVTARRGTAAAGAAMRGLGIAISDAAVAPVLAVGCAMFCASPAGIPDELAKIRPLFNKPPSDATDPQGAKAPGKPGAAEGFADPKGGPKWGKASNGKSGWVDGKGNVWVPTGPAGAPTAHGGSHWDVQKPGGGYTNVYPGGNTR